MNQMSYLYIIIFKYIYIYMNSFFGNETAKKIAELEGKVGKVAQLEGKVAGLEGKVAELEKKVGKVAELEGKVENVATNVGGLVETIGTLHSKLVEGGVLTLPKQGGKKQTKKLKGRITRKGKTMKRRIIV